WTVLVFVIAKIVFMLVTSGSGHFVTSDIWQVITHGISLDLSTALYFLIIPFLLSIASVWITGKWQLYVLRGYFLLISIAFALAFVADSSLYPFWGFKLDASCLGYLETPNEAAASVTTGYIICRVIVLLIATTLIFGGYLLTVRFFPIGKPEKKLIPKLLEAVLYIIFIPLMIIGIRGGLDESTTNIGQVYFSPNQYLNHSAVNPVFSFLASMESTASDNVTYDFMPEAECQRIISKIYNTESIDTDTLLNTQTPNIIIILMESCGGQFTEISGRNDITPNLNRLAQEGIYFTNCYANSWRTDRGTVCTYSGYPSFPTLSVMKIPAKVRTLPCIANSLREERGYSTHYLYGGDINFTKMRGYLVAGGFENLKWKADYDAAAQSSAKWGVRDDITFETLYEMTTSLQDPYLIGYSTLSSHEPWDVPLKHLDDEVYNSFYYLDQCIGNYISKLKKSPQWQNSLVILLPDHGMLYKDIDDLTPLKNHIPMIWIGGAVKAPRRIETICNQTDLPATLLGQLRINHDAYTFSRDVLSKSYRYPLAINTVTEGFSTVDSTGFTFFDLNSQKKIKGNGDINIGKAILQAASKDLNKR
ncbi:MAG: sulfatase-like hydrolase/transferase, partial [Prevotella sp.]|nr:sulfatase-like hydrolase/transferase [Prevotella sp.]